ncbi:MAG: glycosyltransferase [Alphaproteobacteria bacterium]|nr:glycosyltransferase [Alphaproteobacteria bacterium]
MLTVVIPTLDSARTLGACLSSLVPAAVDGLVREVVLADGGSTDDTQAIAEDCGARVVNAQGDLGARLAAGCVSPRGDWLLVLEPDALLAEGWRDAVERQLNAGWDKAGWLPRPGGSWWARLIAGRRPQGLLVSVRRYEASGGFQSGDPGLGRLVRALGAARL